MERLKIELINNFIVYFNNIFLIFRFYKKCEFNLIFIRSNKNGLFVVRKVG